MPNAQRPAGLAGCNGQCKRTEAFSFWGSTRMALAGELRCVVQTVTGFTSKGLRGLVAGIYPPTTVSTRCVTKSANSDEHSPSFTL